VRVDQSALTELAPGQLGQPTYSTTVKSLIDRRSNQQ
jgi:hypothetical protein